jgi:hypothetical protein
MQELAREREALTTEEKRDVKKIKTNMYSQVIPVLKQPSTQDPSPVSPLLPLPHPSKGIR